MIRGINLLLISFFTVLLSCGTESTPSYTLHINVEPAEAGSVSPSSGEFDEGTEISITATPNEHWVFSGWQGEISGNENPATIEINSDITATALFTKRDYPLTVNITGSGNVTEEIVQARTTDYPHGTTVQLTATPDEGWGFAGWDGDLSGQGNPDIITINESKTVTATFEEITHNLI